MVVIDSGCSDEGRRWRSRLIGARTTITTTASLTTTTNRNPDPNNRLQASQGSNVGAYGTAFRPATVSGTITGSNGPATGATVAVTGGASTVAAADGTYTLHLALAGSQTLTASSGDGPVSAAVQVRPGADTRLDFAVERPFILNLFAGWNLISFPVNPAAAAAALFTEGQRESVRQGSLWGWDPARQSYLALSEDVAPAEL